MVSPSNNIKVAALWLLGQGRSYSHVANKFSVSVHSVKRWQKNRDKIYSQNRDELVAHLTPQTLQ